MIQKDKMWQRLFTLERRMTRLDKIWMHAHAFDYKNNKRAGRLFRRTELKFKILARLLNYTS